MRPEPLYPLFAPVTGLKRVGARLAEKLARRAGDRVIDQLWCLPSGVVDRRYAPTLAEAEPGRIASIRVTVERHEPGSGPRGGAARPYRVWCADATGSLALVYFNARPDYLTGLLPIGAERVVSGRVELYRGAPQMVHPDLVETPEAWADLPKVEPVYPLTAGLGNRVARGIAEAAIAEVPTLPEWQDPALLRRQGWVGWRQALEGVHTPTGLQDLAADHPARQRLAYDELLAGQLALALIRAHRRRQPGRALTGDGGLLDAARAALPFALTHSQETATAEILADLGAPERALRLLQGDVGSGKTVVALMAMVRAVEAGTQAALMAPTEVLARQHAETLTALTRDLEVNVALLTGRLPDAERRRVSEGLANGAIHIVVGTQALIQPALRFRDLGLAIIDEQHRFGVEQRMALAAKAPGGVADMLVMTATPIPRTALMAAYGDLAVSRLIDRPPGRKTVDTRVLPMARLDDVVDGLARALDGGTVRKAFWICPLVEDPDGDAEAAAETRHRALRQRFGERVDLVHGRLKSPEKEAAMARFAAEDGAEILVATTVVEVGVDVPSAGLIVIERAEMFGAAQLHQLRGRVGRGGTEATCLMLYGDPISAAAKARLALLRETDDGFRIAEEDLKLRGAGEILGQRQSGLPSFKLASLEAHEDLLAMAHDEAKLIVGTDPNLSGPRGEALRLLLYLFERDAAVRTLRAG